MSARAKKERQRERERDRQSKNERSDKRAREEIFSEQKRAQFGRARSRIDGVMKNSEKFATNPPHLEFAQEQWVGAKEKRRRKGRGVFGAPTALICEF